MGSEFQPEQVVRHVVDRLVAACPSFASVWNEAVSEKASLGEQPTVHSAASELAGHLLKRLLAGRTDEFPALFDTIKTILVEDDPWLAEVFGLYFIEDLQVPAYGTAAGR